MVKWEQQQLQEGGRVTHKGGISPNFIVADVGVGALQKKKIGI